MHGTSAGQRRTNRRHGTRRLFHRGPFLFRDGRRFGRGRGRRGGRYGSRRRSHGFAGFFVTLFVSLACGLIDSIWIMHVVRDVLSVVLTQLDRDIFIY